MNPLLQHLLCSLRRLVRLHLALGGLARVGAVGVAAALGTWALDWWLRLEFAQRGMLGTLALAIIGVAAWRYLLHPLGRRLGASDLALALERAFPQFGDRLVTAVEQCGMRNAECGMAETTSPALLERVTAEATEVAGTVRPTQALDLRHLANQLGLGLATLLVVALALAVFPNETAIWWQRSVLLRDVEWPRATQLALVGFPNGSTRVVRGAPLDITVAASGRKIPDALRLELDYEQAGRFREIVTASVPGRFTKHFDAVVEGFSFRARGGDGETPLVRVEVVDPPMLREVKIRLTYPAYTRQPPRELGPGDGAIEAVIGTLIELKATSTKPLRSSKLQTPSSRETPSPKDQTRDFTSGVPVNIENGTNITARLTVTESGPVQLAIEDVEGLRNNRALAFALYAQPDRPPTARLTVSDIGDKITPQATLPITVEARDDFGVATLSLAWSTNNNQWTSQPMAGVTLGGAEVRSESRWPVEPLRLREGALLNLRVEATDAATPPGRGQSQSLALRVVSAQELLQDLVRRQKEYRAEFERLSRKHREVLDSLRATADNPKSKAESARPAKQIQNLKSLAAWLADEREVGNGCQTLAELFHRIAEEMQNNRVSTPAELDRLETRIAGPLAEVGQQVLNTLVPQLGAITPSQSASLTAAFDGAQAAYDRMRTILAEMVRSETLADAIATLREILRDQNQLNEATKKALEEEIQRLLNRP
ncbi:MAG: hypothetical protein FJ388_08200 [Verrucomicrobia bacterium]|nr:hypothetical protein [Verrucomicrobiota bacterium]